MSVLKSIKGFFKYDFNSVRKQFFYQELDDLIKDKKNAYEVIRNIDKKIARIELMVFGN